MLNENIDDYDKNFKYLIENEEKLFELIIEIEKESKVDGYQFLLEETVIADSVFDKENKMITIKVIKFKCVNSVMSFFEKEYYIKYSLNLEIDKECLIKKAKTKILKSGSILNISHFDIFSNDKVDMRLSFSLKRKRDNLINVCVTIKNYKIEELHNFLMRALYSKDLKNRENINF